MFAKRIKKIAEELNLQYDTKGKVVFGLYKGYKIAIQEYNEGSIGFYNIHFPMKPSDLSQSGNMDIFINELLENKKIVVKAIYEDYCLKVQLKTGFTAGKDILNITDTLDKIENFSTSNYYNPCCEYCGENTNTSIHLINTAPICACEKCYNELIDTLDNAQTNFKNQKSDIVSGIVGAFLGSLVGVALWVVVYAIGYIAVVCGIALAVCILKGYQKFGGKLDKLGITIIVLITILMVFVANYISYGYEIYIAFKDTDNINIFQGIRAVKFFIDEYEDIRRSFIGDLISGYFFTSIGAFSTFINAYKRNNFKYTAQRLD